MIRRLIGYWNGPRFLHVREHFVLQGTIITWTSHERHGVSNHPMLLFVQQLVQANNKENINVQHHRPFLGEFTGNRLISLTKGQLWGKPFSVIKSRDYHYMLLGVYSCRLILVVCWHREVISNRKETSCVPLVRPARVCFTILGEHPKRFSLYLIFAEGNFIPHGMICLRNYYDDGSASVKQFHHLISITNLMVHLWRGTNNPWIYNLTKSPLRNSPSLVKHLPGRIRTWAPQIPTRHQIKCPLQTDCAIEDQAQNWNSMGSKPIRMIHVGKIYWERFKNSLPLVVIFGCYDNENYR